jgi:hypothetical protein
MIVASPSGPTSLGADGPVVDDVEGATVVEVGEGFVVTDPIMVVVGPVVVG